MESPRQRSGPARPTAGHARGRHTRAYRARRWTWPAAPPLRRRAAVAGVALAATAGGLALAFAAGWLAPGTGRVGGFALAGSASAPAPHGWRTVRYQRVRLAVPSSWPVVDLHARPRVCPRLDVHAVYLGFPGPHPRCPASGLGGRTEAVQITAALAGSPQVIGATRITTIAGTRALTSPPSAASHTITDVFPAVRAQVTLTYGSHPGLARRIQATIQVAGRGTAATRPFAALHRAAAPPAGQAQGIVKGLGFDACSAPSSGTMNAWLSSPYRSIGVYIGGADEACAQPNLTSSWINTVERKGWHVFPLYPGPQAPCVDAPGNVTFSASNAGPAGKAAADDAANQAQNLRLPGSTPVIYDMEAYGGCGSAVTKFVNAWDKELHARGYASGVYESTGNIGDLVNAKHSITEPSVIFYANWDGQATTSSSYMPSSMWTNHQRIHQYTGNVYQTYGGITLGIDKDKLDVNLGGVTVITARGRPQTATVDSHGTVRVYDRGSKSGPLWEDHLNSGTGSAWSWFNMKGTWPASPVAMTGSDGAVHVFGVGTDGRLYERHLPAGGGWTNWAKLGGKWQWAPVAVAGPSGTVRLFAVGGDGHLYQKHLRGNGTWTTWLKVGASGLTGTPAATVDASGVVRVYVRNVWGRLKTATLSPGQPWAWANLHGTWRWDPAAIVLGDGSSRVYLVGTDGHMYQKTLPAGGTWSSWSNIGTSRLIGTPAAVVDKTGVIRLFTRLTTGAMMEKYLSPGGTWAQDNQHGMWHYDMSAVVDGSDIVRVYAVGTTGDLYEDHIRVGRAWSGWFNLGGH